MFRLLFIAIAAAVFHCHAVYGKNYRLAVVQAWSLNVQLLMDQCVEDAKSSVLPSGVDISFQFYEEVDQTKSLFSALSMSDYCNNTQGSVWGAVGFTYTANIVAAARVLASFNTPIISHSAVSTELSDKAQFPTFNRVVPADYGQAMAVARLVAQYGWKRVGVIATSDLYGQKLTQAFVDQCQADHVNVVQARSFQAGAVADIEAALKAMRHDDVRIIALFVVAQDLTPVMQAIVKAGMHKAPYLWLGVYANLPSQLFPQGSLGLDIFVNSTAPLYQQLRTRLAARPGWNATFASAYARLYDAGMLMAHGVALLHRTEEACATNGVLPAGAPTDSCAYMTSVATKRSLLNKLIRVPRFTGASGKIALDSRGDNVGAYRVMNQAALPMDYAAKSATGSFSGQNTTWLKPVGMVDSERVSMEAEVAWPEYAVLVPADRRGVRVGDSVSSSVDGTVFVLAFGTATISGWVALILVEQAVASRVRKTTKSTVAWLTLAAMAWAVGAWSACSIGVTSLSLPDLPDNNQAISYDGVLMFTPPLVVIPFTLAAFLAVIRGIRTRAGAKISPRTDASTLNPSHLGDMVSKYGVSANSGSNSGHSHSSASSHDKSNEVQERHWFRRMVLDRLDRNLFVGALLATAGICVMNFMVQQSLVLPCTVGYPVDIGVAAVVLTFPLVYLALYFVFHFRITQLRFIGAFVTAGAVIALHGFTLKQLRFRYTDTQPEHDNNVTVVRLVSAILVAVLSFLFMGLNVTRLKLSRDMLDNYLLREQKRVRSLEKELAAEKESNEQKQTLINLIHLLRPLARKDHFVLKQLEDSMEARLALYGPIAARPRPTTGGENRRMSTMSPTPQSRPMLGAAEDSAHRPGAGGLARVDSPVITGGGVVLGALRVDSPSPFPRSTTFRAPDSPMRRSQVTGPDTDKKSLTPEPTLQDILANPITYEIFKDAVLSHHNTENMAFHADVQQYKREHEDNRLAAARDIAATFIQSNAPHSINISGTLRQSILGKLPTATDDAPPRSLFDGAETEVIRLLVLNDFPRFRESEAYTTCKLVLFATQHIKELRAAERQVRFEPQMDAESQALTLPAPEHRMAGEQDTGDGDLSGLPGHPSVVIESVAEAPSPDTLSLPGSPQAHTHTLPLDN